MYIVAIGLLLYCSYNAFCFLFSFFFIHYVSILYSLYFIHFLRVTAATKMNDVSSRSHAIFTINFTQVIL